MEDYSRVGPRHLNRPHEDLVNEFRAAKADLAVTRDPQKRKHNPKGQITHVKPIDNTALAWLIAHQVLPEHCRYYLEGFLELRHAFLCRVGYRSNSVVLDQFFGAGVSAGIAETLYLRVSRNIGGARTRAVLYAAEAQANDENPADAATIKRLKKHLADYRDCFERLVQAMDNERASLRKELKSGGVKKP